MRAIARRSDKVWLLTHDENDPPARVRVLDLSLGRLYPQYQREVVLAGGEWEMLGPGEQPDVEALVEDVEVMPDDVVPQGIGNISAVTSA